MIHFCTIAYGEKYRTLSLLLLESFNKIKTEETLMHVSTDDASFYDYYKNSSLVVYENEKYTEECGSFKYNYKMVVLDEVSKSCKLGDYIIFLDCDCVIRKPYTTENLRWAKTGLNVSLGKSGGGLQTIMVDSIPNPSVRAKVKHLNPDLNYKYYQFREAFLLFKVGDKFNAFLEEAKRLFDDLEFNNLTHTNICYDIQIICHRCNMNISDVNAKYVPIRDSIFTLGTNGGYCPMIT